MKAAILFFILSSTAFACPNLTGSYTCKKGSNVFTLQVETTAQSYIMNRDGAEMEYVVDGKIYDVPSTDSYKDAKVNSTCEDNKLVVGFEANILYEGSVIAHQVSKSYYYMENSDLILLQKTKMKGIPLPTNKFVCSPN